MALLFCCLYLVVDRQVHVGGPPRELARVVPPHVRRRRKARSELGEVGRLLEAHTPNLRAPEAVDGHGRQADPLVQRRHRPVQLPQRGLQPSWNGAIGHDRCASERSGES
jgi:hypothetical protein